jgi:hypothetical protein
MSSYPGGKTKRACPYNAIYNTKGLKRMDALREPSECNAGTGKDFAGSLIPTMCLWGSFVGRVRTARLSAFAGYVIILAIAIGIGSFPTQASTNNFNLLGNVGDATTSSTVSGSYRYDQWSLPLYPMPSYTARAGDRINATITLDQSYTIPATVPGTLLVFGLYLYGSSYPPIQVSTSTTVSLFNQGASVFSSDNPGAAGGSGALDAAITIFPPNNAPITFDQVIIHSDITYLDGPGGTILNLRNAQLTSTLIVPIPEPCWFAFLATGLTCLALAQKRRGTPFTKLPA